MSSLLLLLDVPAAPGGTLFEETITDAVGITDSVTTAATFARTVTDAVGILDGQTAVPPVVVPTGIGVQWYYDFRSPLFPGVAAAVPPIPEPYRVVLGTHGYELEMALYERGTIDPFRDAQDTGAEPSDASFSNRSVWRRSRSEFGRGAGQRWADAPGALADQFYTSRGIDPWADRGFSLLPDVEFARFATAPLLLVAGPYIYLTDDNSLWFGTSLPSALTEITEADTILALTTTGDEVIWSIDGVGMRRAAVGSGTAAAFGGTASTYAATVLAYVNGWLFAALANELAWISDAGAKTVVKTHPVAGFVWSAIAASPGHIYAAGYLNDERGEVWKVAVDSSGAAFEAATFAGGVPRGETIHSLAYYGGRLLIGTNSGLRSAQVLGDGNLAVGPLIDIGQTVRTMDAWGEYVWFGWSNFDAERCGLGRVRLDRFTDDERPAYASDLMAPLAGEVLSVVRWAASDRLLFSVASGSVWQTHASDLVPDAEIDLGHFTFGASEPKTAYGIQVVTEPLDGEVTASLRDDSEVAHALGTASASGSTGLTTVLGASVTVTSETLEPVLSLVRDTDPTKGPVVRRVTLRALPTPTPTDLWVLPVKLYSHLVIGSGDGQDEQIDTAAEFAYLKELERSRRPVAFREAGQSHTVNVRRVEVPRQPKLKWNAEGTWLEGIVLVTVASVEPT